MPDQTRRDRMMRRLSAMKTERSSFDDQYKKLAEFVSPRRGRFHLNERNRGGQEKWHQIINSQATWALRVATAGMFNGVMSPSRPWLVLETDDPDLSKFEPARRWFFEVRQRMLAIFNASNLYGMMPMMTRELLLFGTGCMSHVDDDEDMLRFYAHTVGSYYIAQSDRFIVDSVYREMDRTVAQIVQQFSERGEINRNISPAVRDRYDRGDYDAWFPVIHVTEPNDNFRLGSKRSSEKPWRSIYFEPGNADRDVLLSDKGFSEFPFYIPRWEVTNEDIYGTDCPGMTALGDIRGLQFMEKRKAMAIDKSITPPMHGPSSLRNQAISHLPAGATFYDAPGQQNILKPVYEVRPQLQDMRLDMSEIEGRINRNFYVDLFKAITNMEGIQPRNQLELSQRDQERLLQLGPTLERLFSEFLDPMTDRTFNQMVRNDLVPPPPPELQGRPLRPKYVSALALAQQAIVTGNIDRLVQFTGSLVSVGWTAALEKLDAAKAVEEYANLIGAPPDLLVPDEIIRQRQEEQAAAQQAQQQAEIANQAAQAAQSVGNIETTEGTVAGQMLQRSGGEVPA